MTLPLPETAHGPRSRVLVCDDDARIAESLAEALTDASYAAETAGRAVDAIQRIMRTRYLAVVLDLKLPGLGGLDAISIIRKLDERLPIIVMTGHASYETEQAVRAAGVFYYLVKPFPLRELTEAVKAAARSHEAGRSPAPPPRVAPRNRSGPR